MEIIRGYVGKVLYENPDNGYKILEVQEEKSDVICTGAFFGVHEGEFLEVQGSWVNHPTYGIQFKMEEYSVKPPEDREAALRYLSSGVIKGIGSAMAQKIVDKFGDDTFNILTNSPKELSKIKGISAKMAEEFGRQVREKEDSREAMIFLQQYGISMNLAKKIYDRYGIEIYRVMNENPYRLASELEGVGFKIADEIARRAGIRVDSEFRIQSGIVYALTEESGLGNTCVPMELLKDRVYDLLGIDSSLDLDDHMINLNMDGRIIVKNTDGLKLVYLPYFYHTELKVASKLHALSESFDISQEKVFKKLSAIEREQGIELDDIQKEAVYESICNGVSIITGGPGTGKTTVINTIIRFFEKEGYEIRLAAPTGRAAKRMSEATGHEASTIHRLLEISGDVESKNVFGRDKDNPIEADCIVVDEMSMVDIGLMSALLDAVAIGTRLILVGDANQLPSVGPGNVLKDIIASECFKVVKLSRIFRQSGDSDIVVNAHLINEGNTTDLRVNTKDFLMVERDHAGIFGAMTTIITSKLPGYVGVTPLDIQVLTPTRVGPYGSVKLNELLQETLNPADSKKREKIHGEYTFREGDKVMQIKNDYQIEWEVRKKNGMFAVETGTGVFNGDMGIITEINTFANLVEVEYEHDGNNKKYVSYTTEQLSELELAYAVTIHKSQGSEYPAIVIPLATGPKKLMSRNLIYTAVTRAKSCVCMVGMQQVFKDMVDNDKEQERYSTLCNRIKELAR